jgi:hypothetical protein
MKQRTAAGTSATKLVVLAKETMKAYHTINPRVNGFCHDLLRLYSLVKESKPFPLSK